MKLTEEQKQEIREAFALLKTKEDLLILLNSAKKILYGEKFIPFTLKQLNFHSNPRLNKHRYFQFPIKKKSGGERIINAPCSGLKAIQNCLSLIFQALYTPHKNAYGFIQGKSIVDNAKKHIDSIYVYNIDLKDFFPSIDQARIWGRLKYPPFNLCENDNRLVIANTIAALCCHEMEVERMDENGEWKKFVKSVLPQGAPCSPVLTNIICERLDYLLTAVAKRFGLRYSRYADDITFSSLHNVYQKDGEFLKELDRIVKEQGFTIKLSKTRLQKTGYRQEVTGLIVNEKVNVSKRYLKQLRKWLYYWEAYGYEKASFFFYSQSCNDREVLKAGALEVDADLTVEGSESAFRISDDLIYLRTIAYNHYSGNEFKKDFEKTLNFLLKTLDSSKFKKAISSTGISGKEAHEKSMILTYIIIDIKNTKPQLKISLTDAEHEYVKDLNEKAEKAVSILEKHRKNLRKIVVLSDLEELLKSYFDVESLIFEREVSDEFKKIVFPIFLKKLSESLFNNSFTVELKGLESDFFPKGSNVDVFLKEFVSLFQPILKYRLYDKYPNVNFGAMEDMLEKGFDRLSTDLKLERLRERGSFMNLFKSQSEREILSLNLNLKKLSVGEEFDDFSVLYDSINSLISAFTLFSKLCSDIEINKVYDKSDLDNLRRLFSELEKKMTTGDINLIENKLGFEEGYLNTKFKKLCRWSRILEDNIIACNTKGRELPDLGDILCADDRKEAKENVSNKWFDKIVFEKVRGSKSSQPSIAFIKSNNLLPKGKKMENVIAGKLEYLKMVKGSNNSTYLKLKKRFDKLVLPEESNIIRSTLSIWENQGIETAMDFYEQKTNGSDSLDDETYTSQEAIAVF